MFKIKNGFKSQNQYLKLPQRDGAMSYHPTPKLMFSSKFFLQSAWRTIAALHQSQVEGVQMVVDIKGGE